MRFGDGFTERLLGSVAVSAFLLGAGLPAPAPAATIGAGQIRAQLSPVRYTTLSAEIGARISYIAQEGAAFGAGKTLVSLDCSIQRAQLNRAQADLSGAEKTYAANKRLQELNSAGQIEVDTSEATKRKAAADVDLAQTLLRKCVISAPFSGRVAEQRAREQQYAQPGQPLLEIIDDSRLELEFLAPSKWLGSLKPGARFNVTIDETGKTYPAQVERTSARIDPVSQSVKVKGVVSGRFPELLAGMSGVVSLSPPASQPTKR